MVKIDRFCVKICRKWGNSPKKRNRKVKKGQKIGQNFKKLNFSSGLKIWKFRKKGQKLVKIGHFYVKICRNWGNSLKYEKERSKKVKKLGQNPQKLIFTHEWTFGWRSKTPQKLVKIDRSFVKICRNWGNSPEIRKRKVKKGQKIGQNQKKLNFSSGWKFRKFQK